MQTVRHLMQTLRHTTMYTDYKTHVYKLYWAELRLSQSLVYRLWIQILSPGNLFTFLECSKPQNLTQIISTPWRNILHAAKSSRNVTQCPKSKESHTSIESTYTCFLPLHLVYERLHTLHFCLHTTPSSESYTMIPHDIIVAHYCANAHYKL